MRPYPLLALASLALMTSGCSGCGSKTQSVVDVPVTLEGVRALHRPPSVVVSVERLERHAGGGGCGHSPICVILVPLMAYDALFPERWDHATVTEGGAVVYDGRFRTSGELIEARARKGGVVRLIGVLPLDKLGRRVIVEAARAPIAPDGGDGAFARTPILPQIDLAAAYREKLAKENDAGGRADLFVEYASWLGDEALPLLTEILPGEPDESAARTVEGVCTNRSQQRWEGTRASVLPLVSARPGPKTAARGFTCALEGSDARALARPFAEALVMHACDQPRGGAAGDAVHALSGHPGGAAAGDVEAMRAVAKAKAKSCAKVSRRGLLEAALGMPLPDTDLRAAIADDDVAPAIAGYLDAARPDQRAAIVDALPGKRSDALLILALARARWTPDARELEVLAGRYADDQLLGGERSEKILDLFDRGKRDETRVGPAKKVIAAAIAAASAGSRPRLRAALVVLGVRDQALPASRELAGHKHVPTTGDAGVVAHALALAGCKREEIAEASKKALSVKDEDRGPLCTR